MLTACMRCSLNVARLCQTCLDRETDPYRCGSGIRQGWRGRADSGLTGGINHLPRQPDAGWQEGGSLARMATPALSEMSFCQPVSGGMLSAINPSSHLSINYFSRVKPMCDMLHFTAPSWSCGTASFIQYVLSQQAAFAWGEKTTTSNRPQTPKQTFEPLILKHLAFKCGDMAGDMRARVDYKSQGRSWSRIDRGGWKLNNAGPGQLDRQERDTALSLRNFHWLKLTDAEHSRQLELTLNKSCFHILCYKGNSSIFPGGMHLMFTV